MLTQEQLRDAIQSALKASNCCSTFCFTDGLAEGDRLEVFHNGVGSGDTDAQFVTATVILNYAPDKMSEHLATWLTALHKKNRLDLNIVR